MTIKNTNVGLILFLWKINTMIIIGSIRDAPENAWHIDHMLHIRYNFNQFISVAKKYVLYHFKYSS